MTLEEEGHAIQENRLAVMKLINGIVSDEDLEFRCSFRKELEEVGFINRIRVRSPA